MEKESRFWKFWKTLPGVLTAIAALLTAIAGLYGIFGHRPTAADKSVVPGPVKPGAREPQPEPSPASVANDRADATAVITESDGSVLTVRANSVRWTPGATPEEIGLNNGQSVPIGKIKTIDVLKVEDAATAIRITLVDGRTIEGSVTGGRVDFGTRFEGESDVGKVSVRVSLVRRIAFQR